MAFLFLPPHSVPYRHHSLLFSSKSSSLFSPLHHPATSSRPCRCSGHPPAVQPRSLHRRQVAVVTSLFLCFLVLFVLFEGVLLLLLLLLDEQFGEAGGLRGLEFYPKRIRRRHGDSQGIWDICFQICRLQDSCQCFGYQNGFFPLKKIGEQGPCCTSLENTHAVMVVTRFRVQGLGLWSTCKSSDWEQKKVGLKWFSRWYFSCVQELIRCDPGQAGCRKHP